MKKYKFEEGDIVTVKTKSGWKIRMINKVLPNPFIDCWPIKPNYLVKIFGSDPEVYKQSKIKKGGSVNVH